MAPTFFACCLFLQSVTPEVIEHAQAGAAAAQQGRLDVAIQEYRKVTELQPNSAADHAHLGDAYFRNGQYTESLAELKTALRLNPNMIDTHQTLGVLLLIQGNPEDALPHLEKMRTPSCWVSRIWRREDSPPRLRRCRPLWTGSPTILTCFTISAARRL